MEGMVAAAVAVVVAAVVGTERPATGGAPAFSPEYCSARACPRSLFREIFVENGRKPTKFWENGFLGQALASTVSTKSFEV